MRFKTKVLLASGLLATTTLPTAAFAASQAECAIWLCLPAGFPGNSGLPSSVTCGDAKRAMISRIKDLKSPLPAFGSCAVPGLSSNTLAKDGMATYVPAHQVCTHWGGGDAGDCIRWETVPEQWTERTPAVCYGEGRNVRQTVNCQSVRWVEVYTDGVQIGGKYYFNLNGYGKLIGGDEAIHENLRANP